MLTSLRSRLTKAQAMTPPEEEVSPPSLPLLATRAGLLDTLRDVTPALEIGPFAGPSLNGPGVKYFDVLDRHGLRERAKQLGIDPTHVPEIDYVSPYGDLSGINEKFRLVFSAHCIEHQPDLIGHLQAVERLLVDGGQYALVIPDCRFCFDHYLPPSTIADVIAAHYEGRRLHSLCNIIKQMALTTHNDTARHWNGDHGPFELDATKVRAAIECWQSSRDTYIDAHAWQFTPDTFRAIIRCLSDLGYIRLRPRFVHDTPYGTCEFTAVLALD